MSDALAELRQKVRWHLAHTLAVNAEEVSPRVLLYVLSRSIRDRMVERMLASESRYRKAGAKRLYYLSMEFLIGRSLINNLTNLGLIDDARGVLKEFHFDLNDVEKCESDAALGNGGLGRLAAGFLDSLATLDMPGYGYGINYEFGLFRQEIRGGEQVELPDNWRTFHSPWLIERLQESVPVPIYGRIEHARDRDGNYNPMWLDWQLVVGVPHDMPIVGYGGETVNFLRLFTARSSQEVDMSSFNQGDYINAVHQKITSETISKVLYPSETVAAGRELRLIQEYFLTACAIRDVVRNFQRDHGAFVSFPDQVAIQLNDTHPTLAIAELMRVFVDEMGLAWEKSWEITTATFGYTNHTLMSEALERWPVELFERVLPRHLQIIYEINRRFLAEVERRWPGDVDRFRRMSLIEEDGERRVRMAHLAIVGSHSVNGVAEVHSRLVRTELVPDFAQMWPEKFNNKTNGITPRRWLATANPAFARLVGDRIGPEWVTDLDRLRALESLANDTAFQEQFRQVKRQNKVRLAALIRDSIGLTADPDSLFDVQVKRIHEYKRQLLNLLHVVHQYLSLRDGVADGPPRLVVFAGKAAPGYVAAKQIIRLIHDVARVVNSDLKTRDRLRVAFVPDYRVTLAEQIIPAADLSEQISTAGTEASGTSNMKFALNGALTIGTLDGANIEIREEVGPENIFIFGLTVEQVRRLKEERSYRPRDILERSPDVKRVMDAFRDGLFCPNQRGRHAWVPQKLLADNEIYFHLADVESYLKAQSEAATLFQNRSNWTAMAIRNVARIGKFSSDRTIRDYAEGIWKIKSIKDGQQI